MLGLGKPMLGPARLKLGLAADHSAKGKRTSGKQKQREPSATESTGKVDWPAPVDLSICSVFCSCLPSNKKAALEHLSLDGLSSRAAVFFKDSKGG